MDRIDRKPLAEPRPSPFTLDGPSRIAELLVRGLRHRGRRRRNALTVLAASILAVIVVLALASI